MKLRRNRNRAGYPGKVGRERDCSGIVCDIITHDMCVYFRRDERRGLVCGSVRFDTFLRVLQASKHLKNECCRSMEEKSIRVHSGVTILLVCYCFVHRPRGQRPAVSNKPMQGRCQGTLLRLRIGCPRNRGARLY